MVRQAPTAVPIFPFNNIATYTSPGNPNLSGTPYQLPAALGNLLDLWLKK